MDSRPRIVLDTNVFLVAILPKHKYWWVFQAFMDQKFILLLSTEILTEYIEKCIDKYGSSLSEERLEFLLEFPNVELVTPFYRWNLINDDPDDNKFVDCAVAGQADHIVSHDKHLNVLKQIPFPRVNVVRLPEFHELLNGNKTA
jgi:uncharacterized protein